MSRRRSVARLELMSATNSEYWERLLARRVAGAPPDAAPAMQANLADRRIHDLFFDLAARPRHQSFVLAHLGQSLDGRIATESGHSHYIGGYESLAHLHRLRAMSDAVIVGVETAIADKPRLTTRHVTGPSPVRIVLDPRGRLPADHNLRIDKLAPTIVLTREVRHSDDVEVVSGTARFRPNEIIEALARRGLHHLLVEGGGRTVSAFLEARALDRLQLAVAPLIIGSGRPAISLPVIEQLDQALRPPCRRFELGTDTLFDMDLSDR